MSCDYWCSLIILNSMLKSELALWIPCAALFHNHSYIRLHAHTVERSMPKHRRDTQENLGQHAWFLSMPFSDVREKKASYLKAFVSVWAQGSFLRPLYSDERKRGRKRAIEIQTKVPSNITAMTFFLNHFFFQKTHKIRKFFLQTCKHKNNVMLYDLTWFTNG